MRLSPQARQEKKKKDDLEFVRTFLQDKLTGNAYNLVMAQLTHSVRNNRKRWSKEFKVYCLALSYKSPAAYRFLRKTFAIPSQRTLQRLFENFVVAPGFSPQLFSLLSDRCSKMSERSKYCSISFDELSLSANLSFDAKSDRILGFEDFGPFGTTKKVGNHGLVFMASGLFSSWKQPLGFFISRSATSAAMLKQLLEECLSLVLAAGLIPKNVICDMGSCNQKLFNSLGVTPENPFFFFQGRKILAFFDPPHLLKCVRNNLHAHDFVVNGDVVSWRYIRKMYDAETDPSKSSFSMRLAPKLTDRHIFLPAFSKMKVSRAAQVLSQSVYAALLSYICSGEVDRRGMPTAHFIRKMDSLFDIFNSSGRFDRKLFRQALCDDSPSLKFLREMQSMFSSLTVLGLKQQPPCIKGWLTSINALLILWEDVTSIESLDIKYLCTRKINQDCLENCFSVIRSNGSNGSFCATPDVESFTHGYKHVLVKSCLTNSNLSNCEVDGTELLVDFLTSDVSPQSTPHAGIVIDDADLIACPTDTCAENPETRGNLDRDAGKPQTLAQASITCYVAGYVCHKYLKNHQCLDCAKAILGTCADIPARSTLLTRLKAYDTSLSESGNLCIPSAGMLKFIESSEKMFVESFERVMQMPGVMSRLVGMIKNSVDVSWFSACNCLSNISKIIMIFVKCRVYYALKFHSRGIAKRSNKRNRRADILARE